MEVPFMFGERRGWEEACLQRKGAGVGAGSEGAARLRAGLSTQYRSGGPTVTGRTNAHPTVPLHRHRCVAHLARGDAAQALARAKVAVASRAVVVAVKRRRGRHRRAHERVARGTQRRRVCNGQPHAPAPSGKHTHFSTELGAWDRPLCPRQQRAQPYLNTATTALRLVHNAGVGATPTPAAAADSRYEPAAAAPAAPAVPAPAPAPPPPPPPRGPAMAGPLLVRMTPLMAGL